MGPGGRNRHFRSDRNLQTRVCTGTTARRETQEINKRVKGRPVERGNVARGGGQASREARVQPEFDVWENGQGAPIPFYSTSIREGRARAATAVSRTEGSNCAADSQH